MNPRFLNVVKPIGWTSNRVLSYLKKELGVKKMGHGGTLDPLATGVLPIAVGGANRLFPFLNNRPKIYLAVIRLGLESDTDDRDGDTINQIPLPLSPPGDLEKVLDRFVGDIDQVPPTYSALRVAGRRAYNLARKGKPVPLASRKVTINELRLVRVSWPDLILCVTCGPGTYIRALARDIGKELGTGAVLWRLVRIASGPFRLRDARPPGKFTKPYIEQDGPGVIHPAEVLSHLPAISLNDDEARAVINGRPVYPAMTLSAGREPFVLLLHRGETLGIGRLDKEGSVQPKKIINTSRIGPDR